MNQDNSTFYEILVIYSQINQTLWIREAICAPSTIYSWIKSVICCCCRLRGSDVNDTSTVEEGQGNCCSCRPFNRCCHRHASNRYTEVTSDGDVVEMSTINGQNNNGDIECDNNQNTERRKSKNTDNIVTLLDRLIRGKCHLLYLTQQPVTN